MEASEGGKIPIVCDTSPCLSQIKVRTRGRGLAVLPTPAGFACCTE